jgi:hypothetical protein
VGCERICAVISWLLLHSILWRNCDASPAVALQCQQQQQSSQQSALRLVQRAAQRAGCAFAPASAIASVIHN